MQSAVHSENKKILFSRYFDKKDYCEIKGSHKINANSNSAPSWACVRADGTYLNTLSSDVCAITEFSETRPMLQPLESHFLPLDSFFPFYCSLVLSFLSVRGKDLLSDLSAMSHLNSIILYFLFSISNWYLQRHRDNKDYLSIIIAIFGKMHRE